VIPTLSRPDPDDIIARHGATGERFVALLRDSASTLFDVVRANQIQLSRNRPAGSAGAFARAHQDRRTARAAMSKFGASSSCSRAIRPANAGIRCLVRRFWNKTGGHINPLALSRGLARVVLDRGGRIYARHPRPASNGRATAGW